MRWGYLALPVAIVLVVAIGKLGTAGKTATPTTGAAVATTARVQENITVAGTLVSKRRSSDGWGWVLDLDTPDGFQLTVYLDQAVRHQPLAIGERLQVTGNVPGPGAIMVTAPDGLKKLRRFPTVQRSGFAIVEDGYALIRDGERMLRLPAGDLPNGQYTNLTVTRDDRGLLMVQPVEIHEGY